MHEMAIFPHVLLEILVTMEFLNLDFPIDAKILSICEHLRQVYVC